MQLNALGVAHFALQEHVQLGAFCIDATAGKGRDTAFLASLCKESGRVVALDIQHEAVEQTKAHIAKLGLESQVSVYLADHQHIDRFASPNSVDAIVFNFGWLPGGDHTVFTRAQTSILAIQKGLGLLKPGGLMTLCIYYGRECGFEERDALLEYVKTMDAKTYSVLVCQFANRTNCPASPVLIYKRTV